MGPYRVHNGSIYECCCITNTFCIRPLHLGVVLCIQRIQHIIDVLKAFELQLWPATAHAKTALRKEFHYAMDGNRILNRGLSLHSCGPPPLMLRPLGRRTFIWQWTATGFSIAVFVSTAVARHRSC